MVYTLVITSDTHKNYKTIILPKYLSQHLIERLLHVTTQIITAIIKRKRSVKENKLLYMTSCYLQLFDFNHDHKFTHNNEL